MTDLKPLNQPPLDGHHEWSQQLRARFLGISMFAVGLACLVFALARYYTMQRTGLATPWLVNATGLAIMLALYLWYRRSPQRRSRFTVHATAVVATLALLIPAAYAMPSTVWWLSLIGFAMALMSRRREAYVWAVSMVLLIAAVPVLETWLRVANAAGEQPLELNMARVAFAVILFGIAFAFRREIERRTADLMQLANDLRAANATKDRFIAHMSHELRTPLHGLLGTSEQMLGEIDHPLHQQRLHAIRDSGNALLQLLNDLIDVSSARAGTLTLTRGPVNLCDTVAESVRGFATRAQQKGLELHFHVAPEVQAWRMGDEARIRQTVFHLVSNAVKFTDSGRVCMEIEHWPEWTDGVVLRLSDSGCGIPAELVAQIGQPFVREETPANRRHAGAGLGLALVFQLVRSMQGQLSFSAAQPQGTVVEIRLRLPIAQISAGAQVADAEPSQDQLAPQATPLRVLYCEDDPIGQDLIEAALTAMGHSCTRANDGAQGLALVASQPFDLVLTDLEMPKVDGYTLLSELRRLQQQSGQPRIPVVAVTAHAGPEDRDRFLQLGFDGFLAKPFRMAALGRALKAVADDRRAS